MTTRQYRLAPDRPLPRPVRPYQDETTRSFIRRINSANVLTHGELIKTLRRDRRPWMYDLATWNGTLSDILVLAMPQLANSHPDPRLRLKLVGRPTRTTHAPACRHCTLARGAGPYVEVYTTHERTLCPDHKLWIGDGIGTIADQFNIAACPEIIEAWHHHKNLITRHGHAQVRRAFHISSVINWSWYEQFQHFSAAMDTYESLTADHARQVNSPALVAAALYPSIVKLTAAIASPRWRYIARSRHPEAFLDRVGNEITEGWTPQGTFDPLRHWMETNWTAEFRGSDTILPPKNR